MNDALVLPSIAMTSPSVTLLIDLIQLRKAMLEILQDKALANTRANVSWLGTPFGSSKNCPTHSNLASP